MKASLIVTLYKNLPFIDLILQTVAKQTEKDFELIIAEDDNAPETLKFLEEQRKKYHFPILHCSHENLGFRKNKILNQAILKSSADYLILIDGDCLLHPEFIAQHLKNAKPNQTIIGRRLMISEQMTEVLLKENTIKRLNFFNFIRFGCKKLDCGLYLPFLSSKRNLGVWGCNWSFNKDQILAINGFDEDYVKGSVGEDTDVEWRLRANGSSFKAVKFKAVQYHLHHKLNYSDLDGNENYALFKSKQKLNHIICKNGIEKL